MQRSGRLSRNRVFFWRRPDKQEPVPTTSSTNHTPRTPRPPKKQSGPPGGPLTATRANKDTTVFDTEDVEIKQARRIIASRIPPSQTMPRGRIYFSSLPSLLRVSCP